MNQIGANTLDFIDFYDLGKVFSISSEFGAKFQYSREFLKNSVASSAHWTYFIKILSNYNTQNFKNSVIVALKTDIVTFYIVKSLKVISGFNLIKVKNLRGPTK